MMKNDLKTSLKGSRGITLIALVVSIIVLLILAGVSISAITGNESAMEKAKEAGQKNEIGAAKDDISLTIVNAKMQGMENVYLKNGVSASDAQNVVGRTVIQAVADKYATNNQIGKATITIDVEKTNNVITDDASITVSTTDFEVEGIITLNDGILTWDEIVPNMPRIKLNKNNLTLAPGGTSTLSVKFKQLEETTIEWSTSDTSVATVLDGVVTIKTTANDDDTAIITAKATYGDKEYTATCNVLVAQVSTPATQALINTSTMIGADVMNYTANEVGDWQVFYATENEVFIISKNVIEMGTDITSNNSDYPDGSQSDSLSGTKYGKIWNSKWISKCTTKITNNNAITVAYLCDENKWTSYKKNGVANYAVGGPTFELLVASKKAKSNGEIDYTNSLESTDSSGYNNPISSDLGTPYRANAAWWIASPSKGGGNGIFILNFGNGLPKRLDV